MATIVDTLVGSCINKLQAIITDKTILILGVKDELEELQRRTNVIRSSLQDAEARRMEDSVVEKWLDQLRDVMYDVDDIIDLARFKGSVLLPDYPMSSSRKATACSGLSLSSCFSNIRIRHEVAVKIRSLNKKIDNISKDEVFLKLNRRHHNGSGSAWTPIESSSLVEPNLVGKEVIRACREVVDLVLAHKKKNVYKLAIVGTGGVGKTTLAQKIFNDKKLEGRFDHHAWACVSKEYSRDSLLRQVLRNMGIRYEQDESVPELQRKIKSHIANKSFFLVSDDVWNSEAWTDLLSTPLHAAATGVILITTRDDTIARVIGVDHTHRVDLMSADVGWELLWRSMNIKEEKQVKNLRDTGIEIVRKCGGLPLAIRAIAKVLASLQDQTENEWRQILGKNAWSMSKLPDELNDLSAFFFFDNVREIGVEEAHRVDLMSPAVGWELLWKSMNIQDEKEVQNLRDIGIEIVQKCGGLPLAIKVTARVLASKDKTENKWKRILAKNVWSMAKLPKEISGALYLSYDDLPLHLKQCFLYCIVFPEDWTLKRDELIMMWVAEGFVEVHKDQLLEDTAEEYYYELIIRNLLQPVYTYFDQSRCKMHDLLRQLACYLSREECHIGDLKPLVDNTICKLRRMLVVGEKDTVVIPFTGKEEIKLRTFTTDHQLQGVDNTFFMRLTHLRVLDLSDSLVQTIPDYIGNLIHLRMFDLDGTNISCLPESIGSLQNLLILNLKRCKYLHFLPLATTQLYNLRRLGLADTPINQVPKGIGRLKFLNDLEGFPIGGGSDNTKMQDGWNLEELAHLSQLRCLDMIKLERATPCSSRDPFLLTEKKHLKVLNLHCTEQTDEAYSEEGISNVEKIFEKLAPPHNLEDLVIGNFFGCRFPTWLGTNHLPSVKYVVLIDCKSCVHLPPIGQLPNLKYLKINGASAITKIGPEFVGCWEGNLRSTEAVAFPKLEALVIEDMPNWEEWCQNPEPEMEKQSSDL
uniref:NB-ARC domain containing protein, expressed n=2 Tax=Oryza sativa subsp. japonica TaxID=39947 RepID=Q2QZS6_ORYSJ|nr:NB-ARC domain containing protein, expressed [Oryza sativa Japonica Group]